MYENRRIDVMIVMLGLALQQVLTFVTGVIVARMLGAAGYGIIGILRNTMSGLLTLGPLGLDLALLKHLPRYGSRFGTQRLLLTRLRLLVFSVNAAIGILALCGGAALMERHVYQFPHFSQYLLTTLIGLPFAADIVILGAFYRAKDRPAAFAVMTNCFQPFLRLAGSLFVLWQGWGLLGIVIFNTAAYVMSDGLLLAHMLLWRPLAKRSPDEVVDNSAGPVVSILQDSLWMAGTIFLYGAMRFVDVLVLGVYRPAYEVGAYSALSILAQLVQLYPFAVSQTLGPSVSHLHSINDMAGVRRTLGDYIGKASLMAGFIFAGVAVFGDRMDLIFGPSFHFLSGIAFLMSLGWLVSATLGPVGYALSMTGAHRVEFGILLLGALVLVGLCFALTPLWGQYGAASATLVAFLAVNIARFAYVSRSLGFIPGKLTDFLPPLTALAAAFLAKTAAELIFGRHLIALVSGSVLYTCVFAGLALAFHLDKKQRASLLKPLVGRRG